MNGVLDGSLYQYLLILKVPVLVLASEKKKWHCAISSNKGTSRNNLIPSVKYAGGSLMQLVLQLVIHVLWKWKGNMLQHACKFIAVATIGKPWEAFEKHHAFIFYFFALGIFQQIWNMCWIFLILFTVGLVYRFHSVSCLQGYWVIASCMCMHTFHQLYIQCEGYISLQRAFVYVLGEWAELLCHEQWRVWMFMLMSVALFLVVC